jgi:tRNA(Ile)-lysidine synthase
LLKHRPLKNYYKDNMKEQFLHFNHEHQLIDPDDKILLTVSGGIDSMTMLHLFKECGFDIVIAHCNFCLRGAESDGDQELVECYAHINHIPLHINRFDTLAYADAKKISIQMAARDLRYNWFEKLATENKYNKIATAHNANDVIETFLINLTRGTGIHGLTGISVKNKNIIRPLLFATRNDIVAYSKECDINYREDSSNSETKYLRNAIRHKIIPQFEKLNPAFLKNITHTASILQDAENIFNKSIDDLKKLVINEKEKFIQFNIAELIAQKITPAILYEIIAPYGFSFDTAMRMLKHITNQPGATYFSKTHKVVKDRNNYILYPLEENDCEEYTIQESAIKFEGPVNLKIKRIKADKHFELKRNKEVANFDAEKLIFPLKLRRWQHGDFFFPFGMRGKKKISDYFNDQKISIPEKENTWLLCSGNEIIWIVNHRTDNLHTITKTTKEVVQFELLT